MDLRTVFGEWKPGQPIRVRDEKRFGAQEYIVEAAAFGPDRVELRSVDKAHPFTLTLESKPSTSGSEYAFSIDRGSEVIPVDLSGSELKGMWLPSPPAPITLFLHGKLTLSSNTLQTSYTAKLELTRIFRNANESVIKISNAQEEIQEIQFLGLEKK